MGTASLKQVLAKKDASPLLYCIVVVVEVVVVLELGFCGRTFFS